MLTAALVVVGLALAGLFYQWLGERRDRRKAPAPGRMVGGLHVHVTGEGGPVVVLESGIAASSVSWQPVQEGIQKFTTVVSYDRAGFGWSAERAEPRTVEQLNLELHETLAEAGLQGPFVLVGHSFGGLLSRYYAARYKGEVAALVLADPLEPMEWRGASGSRLKMLGRGVTLSRRGAWLARLGVVRLGLEALMSGSRALPKLLAKASSGRGSSVTDRLVGEVRKLPAETWPAVKAHWCLPKSFRTMAEYLERLPEACAGEPGAAGVPIVVISAGKNQAAVIAEHAKTAAGGEHVLADGAGHWVQLDAPERIVDAVLRIVISLRAA